MHHQDIFSAFDRFQAHLPLGGDLTLMVLKGHLLIEEQVFALVNHRLPTLDKEADLTSHQLICLAEALIAAEGSQAENSWLWPAVKKLNKLRNDMAHNLEKPGVHDRIVDFVGRVPRKLESANLCHNFEFALWTTCAEVHLSVARSEPSDFESPPEPELDASDFANAP